MIIKCTCQHEYQDKKYGKDKRVWNPTMTGIRCTVCGTTISDELRKEVTQKRKGRK